MTGANPQRGEVTVDLAGTTFTLVPSFRRIARLEATLGKSLMQLMSDLGGGRGVTFGEVATVVHVMARLDGDQKKLTVDDVGALVVRHGLARSLVALQGFLVAALGGGEDAEGNADGGAGGSTASPGDAGAS